MTGERRTVGVSVYLKGHVRSDVAAKLEVWATEGLDEGLVEADRMAIFWLLAGDVKGALGWQKIDWKRFLGLVMWYELSPDTDWACLIERFEGLVEKQDAPKPVPKYVEERVSVQNRQSEGEGYDIAYYLMLLHAKQGRAEVSSRRMLSASASTFHRLDHKLAWHQQGILHVIQMLEAEQLHEVHMNFASQLLSAGLCHWAVVDETASKITASADHEPSHALSEHDGGDCLLEAPAVLAVLASSNLRYGKQKIAMFHHGLYKQEGKDRYGENYRMWQRDAANFEIDGHYPVRELWARAQSCWQSILDSDGISVLVVAHNAVNQALVATATGLGPEYFRQLLQSNCGVSVLDFTPRTSGDGPPYVCLDRLNQDY